MIFYLVIESSSSKIYY